VGSFGEKLRRERELRAITIQEISVATKIGTRILTALEEEDFDKLPGGIFNKGFVRAYARYVGIDEEKAVADYLDAAKNNFPDQDFQVVATQMEAARQRDLAVSGVNGSRAGSIAGAIVAVALLAVVAGGYHWRFVFPLAAEKIKVTLKGHKTPPPATTSAAQPTVTPAPVPITAPTPEAIATTTLAQPDANSAGTPAATNPIPSDAKPATKATTEPSAGTPAVVADGVTLEIEAKAKSWVAVTTDGQKTMQATLEPGTETSHVRSFKAQNRITLITGNPAGLLVTYNGKKLEPWSGPGRRMMVTFTPEGYTVQ
jgi:cytoskeleton protein RodZ